MATTTANNEKNATDDDLEARRLRRLGYATELMREANGEEKLSDNQLLDVARMIADELEELGDRLHQAIRHCWSWQVAVKLLRGQISENRVSHCSKSVVKGIIDRVAWHSNEELPFCIINLVDGLCVKGKADLSYLTSGITYQFEHTAHAKGKSWENNAKYGVQFSFDAVKRLEPHDRNGVVRFLQRYGKGIGPTIAGRLYDVFGGDAVKQLRTNPVEASKRVRGLTREVAQNAAIALQQDVEFEDARIDLTDLFAGRHFPHVLIKQCIDKWGILAAERVKRDPFTMLVEGFSGCGFKRCDRLYMDLGLPPERLKRQTVCIWHELRSNSNGHTWRPARLAADALKRHISAAKGQPIKAIELGVRSGWLSSRTECNQRWIAVGGQAKSERDVARQVLYLSTYEDEQLWPDPDDIEGLSDSQREETENCFTGAVGLLTGTPGTGKTYTAAAIIKAIQKMWPGEIELCAPTGKAAVRLTQAMHNAGARLEAKTIHRLLRVTRNGHDGKGWGFDHNESNPLESRFILVDEASMLDCDLAASLLTAIGYGSRVLFIGDPHQLPPVGHGAPLRDMIEAGVSHGELTEIHRNEGGVVAACRAIKDTGRYRPARSTCVAVGENLKHWECSSAGQSISVLRRLLSNAKQAGVDPIWDVQILTANNDSSDLSRKPINDLCQNQLNPTTGQSSGQFRLDDKVICISNTTLTLCNDKGVPIEFAGGRKVSEQDAVEEFVANGEIGRVVWFNDKRTQMAVKFSSPNRTVRTPLGKAKGTSGDLGSNSTGCKFELGYAITCHKSQGSSARIVIVMADDSHAADRVCSREWWYTAISRTEQLCITIGKALAINRQCKRVGLRDRKTFLQELLIGEME